ncbi:hypothetical protein [Pseudomonas sp. S2_H10]|jgi:hypothetical protein
MDFRLHPPKRTQDQESAADWHKGCKVHIGLTCSACLGAPSVNDDRLAGQSVGDTAKEQAKAPGTEGFQALFFAFSTALGGTYENSRTIAETEGHAKPASP